jgi:uncharacterized protein (DUF4415 family)
MATTTKNFSASQTEILFRVQKKTARMLMQKVREVMTVKVDGHVIDGYPGR